MDRWRELADLAAGMHGVVSRREALRLAIPPSTLSDQFRIGGFERLRRGAIALPGSQPSPWRRVAAAVTAVGPPVAVCGWSAAWAHGLVRHCPTKVELVVPVPRRAPERRGVVGHRTRSLPGSDIIVVNGIPCTSPARTVVGLAAVAAAPVVRGMLIDARQRRQLTLPQVTEVAARFRTAQGAALIRRLAWELSEERADSVLEEYARTGLRERGLRPEPEPVPVAARGRTVHIDIGFLPEQVGLECDGMGSHSERGHLNVDALRANGLAHTDWKVLRLTWHLMETAFDDVVAQLRSLLQARSPT